MFFQTVLAVVAATVGFLGLTGPAPSTHPDEVESLVIEVVVDEVAGPLMTETLDVYLLDGTIVSTPINGAGTYRVPVPETGDYLVARTGTMGGATSSGTCPGTPVTVTGPVSLVC